MTLREVLDHLPASSTVRYGSKNVEIEYYRRFLDDNLDQEVVLDWQGSIICFYRVQIDREEPDNSYNNIIKCHPYLRITTTLPPFDPTVRGENNHE